MSDNTEVLWIWRGWFGPFEIASEAKLVTDAIDGATFGVKVPLPGEPPMYVDPETQVFGMWAVQLRPDNNYPTPEGCWKADDNLVGRMVNA